jgi:hypothetical protein
MLPKLARGLFLVAMVAMIAAYAVTLANSSPPPVDPNDFVVQWC